MLVLLLLSLLLLELLLKLEVSACLVLLWLLPLLPSPHAFTCLAGLRSFWFSWQSPNLPAELSHWWDRWWHISGPQRGQVTGSHFFHPGLSRRRTRRRPLHLNVFFVRFRCYLQGHLTLSIDADAAPWQENSQSCLTDCLIFCARHIVSGPTEM